MMRVTQWQAATFAAALSLATVGSNLSLFGMGSQAPPQRHPTRPPGLHTCADNPPTNQSMFVPLAHARFFGGVDLMLNNRGPIEHAVVPTWYIEGQGAIVGESFTLPPAQMHFHFIQEFLPRGVPLSRVQGLELAYTGHSREVWAQALLRPTEGAEPVQSLDDPFSMTMDFRTSTLNGVWPVLQPDQRTIVALANTSNRVLTVTATDPDGHHDVLLLPHTGDIMNLAVREHSASADWLQLSSDGAPGDLRATGFTQLATDRLPRLVRFYDPGAAQSANLFATGVPVQGTLVTIALKNLTSSAIAASADILDPTSGSVLISLPSTTVKAGSAAQLDLRHLRSVTFTTGQVGLRVNNTGAPGSVIGTLYAESDGGDTGYEMPLRDVGPLRRSTGGYPWRLDGDYETKITITNVGAASTTFVARLHYGSTDYVFAPQSLAAGATATFDFRELRAAGKRDRTGQVIPLTLQQGQFYWTKVDGHSDIHLIGRSEVVSAADHVSSSYSCDMCCPDGVVGGGADDLSEAVGDSDSVGLYQTFETCMGDYYNDDLYADSSSILDPSVASISASGSEATVTGDNSGSTTATVLWSGWSYDENANNDGTGNCDPQNNEFSLSFNVTVACPVPTNFRRTGSTNYGDGTLQVNYDWSSTIGSDKSNLASCSLWESVAYDGPNPYVWPYPMVNTENNPLVGGAIHGNSTAADYHSPPPSYSSPLASDSGFTGLQAYYYACPCLNDNGAGHLINNPPNPNTIFRVVSFNDPDYYYTITKNDFMGNSDTNGLSLGTFGNTLRHLGVHLPPGPR